ncbi:piezo-type mechanosensitive ion channel component 2-like isoform X2 [Littorina saxatilis]|uniref:piezo-type mechanosensitive ion channel component 2-like isoform X2 n=1 Tax=Littorina saxatilis TaxID=31220 RepID=UPI0038B5FCAA
MAEKVTTIVCWCLFRLLLPLTLLAAALVRFNGLSFTYLVCLLVTPLLPYPMVNSMAGCTGRFLKGIVGLSVLFVLAHSVFHITLVSIATDSEPYGSMFPNCSFNEKIARQFGFQRLGDEVPVVDNVRMILPDVMVLLISLVVLVVCRILIHRDVHEQADLPMSGTYIRRRRKMASALNYVGEFFVGLLLASSGIMVPSVFNAVYFLVFLVLGVLWACYMSLGNRFAYVRMVLMTYTGAHILVLYLYQFQFFQEALPREDLIARLLGLTGIFETDCSDASSLYGLLRYPDVPWMYYINPGVLLLLYWVLAFETTRWFRTKNLTPEEILKDSLVSSQTRLRKRKRDVERQVPPDLDETGSLVFSGSTYGDDGADDEERLVDEGENVNYNSIEQGGEATPQVPGTSQREKNDEPSEFSRSISKPGESKRVPLVSVFMFAMKQSYVLMLIAMMAWSIMYLSWLTFVLLLGACILWMLPNSRRACLVTSPLLVLYSICLLLALYVYNMDLEKELPTAAGKIEMKEIGLMRFDTAPPDLAFQIFFTMFFLMTLRQFMRERKPDNSSVSEIPLRERGSNYHIEGFTDFMSHFLMEVMCKYWIFICTGMFLLIAVQEVVIYRIIYMVLFLFFIIIFQVSYPLWRAIMFAFWWLVILYSMAVLIIIYTYQFEDFPGYWQNNTGWDSDTLADIGLEKFGGTDLFIKLLTPTSFLIVIILQVHYFHKHFLRLSAIDRYTKEEEVESEQRYNRWLEAIGSETETEFEEDPNASIVTKPSYPVRFKAWLARIGIVTKTVRVYQTLTTFLWRLAEIHIFKVIIFIVMFVATNEDEVSAMTAIYVILVALLLPFIMTKVHLVLSNLIVIWTSLIILCKMIYQLRLVPVQVYPLCEALNKTLENKTVPERTTHNTVWVGLSKIDGRIDHYIKLYILVLAVVLFESITRYHQRQHFNHPDSPKPVEGILFRNVTREDADKGLLSCLKFFANHTFYKFGLEICYVTTAVTICIRMDAYAVLYAILLGIMMLFTRRTSSRIWWLYMLVLAILLPIQYLTSLGFPAVACITFPWTSKQGFITPLLERWLYIPDVENSPPSIVLMADILQLLFVVLQWRVFRMEVTGTGSAINGGDNSEIVEEHDLSCKIAVEDFTITSTMYLDVFKQGVYEYMFWVTLAVVFIAGATRVNIFGLGYVIAVFCFMWYGKEFLLKPLRKLLRMWNFLIAYVVFVLFAKACLQLVGCVYVNKLFQSNCWVVQLFGINCLLPTEGDIIEDAKAKGCIIVEDNTGLTWDVVCFAFLLLQRRIYGSHYFRHVVDLLSAQSRLSSRGAELINRILVREVEIQKEQEHQILLDIKRKMTVLKERQTALRKDFQEPTEHFQAIRAGDYYLFEEADEEEEQEEKPDSLTFGRSDDPQGEKRLGPLQVITTAMDKGAASAITKVKQQDEPDGAKAEMGQSSVDPKTKDEDQSSQDAKLDSAETAVEKAKTWGNFFATLIGSIADWLIRLCNQISRNYRLVARKLEGELRIEKDRIKREKIRGRASSRRSTPKEEESADGESAKPLDVQEVVLETDNFDEPCHGAGALESLDELEARADDREREFGRSQPRAYRLLVAVIYMLISRSELLCYFLMIVDQMIYGSLLSLPLPFMVFLWGMLSVPRPSKTFWITVITYTEAVVVTKYLFQFGFFPWNDGVFQESPFYPPRILGIEQKENYANVDIALLLALFLHRSILKRYGLWKDSKDINEDMERAGQKERSPPTTPQPISDQPGQVMEVARADESDVVDKLHPEEEHEDGRLKKTLKTGVAPFVIFFKKMTDSVYNATVDVYAPMFCCDFINFFIVVFGYTAFGPQQQSGDGDVTSYIMDNRVPVPFLVMLIVQFVLIVIDRALFLRKNVLGKCVFQILLVIVIHIWMFFALPKVTGTSFFDNIPAQLWYFVKCIYFALSAYQIRCGYPTRILGNFLTKKYNYLNLFLFKGFLGVPFLLELRALMDWIWTDSTLAISSWLQMEDIYANIFVLKCWRHSEVAYPTPRSQKKMPIIKYCTGGLLLLLIILIIWFPLVIFAISHSVFHPNPPSEVTIHLQLGAYQPLFKMTVQQNIRQIQNSEKAALAEYFGKERNAISFLNRFELSDISVVSFSGESTAIWGISEPAQKELIRALQESKNKTNQQRIKLEFSMTIVRSSDSKSSDTLTTYYTTQFSDTAADAFIDLINGTRNESAQVNGVFPRFMQITNKGISEAKSLIEGGIGFKKNNLQLGLSGDVGIGKLNQYWTLREEIYRGSHFVLKKDRAGNFTSDIKIITFNDRKAPSTLSFLSGYGIIGLYVSFILLIGRFLRMATTGQLLTIMFRELPQVDNILQTCLDIYLVREMKEFHLEEDLYAKLIFVYRSPETMIKWTRPKVKRD